MQQLIICGRLQDLISPYKIPMGTRPRKGFSSPVLQRHWLASCDAKTSRSSRLNTTSVYSTFDMFCATFHIFRFGCAQRIPVSVMQE